MWDLPRPETEDWTRVPCIGRRILIYWTTWEIHMQICREPLCFSHFSNILLCKFQLPQQSRTRFSSSQFIETAVSNGLPLPATEGRNRDYCGAYFVCFPFLRDYNSASFGWSPVAEFGRRGFIRSLELGSVFFPMAESSCLIHFFSCFWEGILAWEIPWSEEPAGLQSMGS